MRKQSLAAPVVALALLAGSTVAAFAEDGEYPKTKIQGRFYGDITSKKIKDDGTGDESSDTGTGIDVKRFYFTVTHEINETWSAQFQSDIGDFGTKRYDVFVKKAYLQGRFSDALTVRLGSADTPWVPFSEKMYGLRYIENVMIDQDGFGTSADWGLHLMGKAGSGKVGYQLSAINGGGYSNPSRSNSLDLEGRLDFTPVKGFTFAIGGYNGKLGKDTSTNSPAKHTAQRTDALVNWTNDRVGFGVEYFQAKNWKQVTSDDTDKASGTSIWTHFDVGDDSKVFVRYDTVDPSEDLNSALNYKYYNVGWEKTFNKVMSGSLVYKHADSDNGTFKTGNGTVGSDVPGKSGAYDEFGVWVVYNF
jgi:hypothetical protein